MLSPRFNVRAEKLIAAIHRIRNAAADGAFRDALMEAGNEILAWMQREYRGGARRNWKRLRPVTVILSRARLQGPITSWAGLRSALSRAQPLIDTGRTYQSLVRGVQGNIFRLSSSSITVGSSSPELVANQNDRTSIFNFGPDEQARFNRNVPATYGKRNRSNDVHARMLGVLKKMDGKSFKVPGRPLPRIPPAAIVTRLRRNIALILKARWQAGA